MTVQNSSYIQLNGVGQSFMTNDTRVELFSDLNLSIIQGQSYAITGPSGSGKSSLLMLMSGLEAPTQGHVNYVELTKPGSISLLREDIGFVFQQFHLLPELTALNNVALPLKLRGCTSAESKARLCLESVGLGHRLGHKPHQMSGGEQQRVAIARAPVFEPKFIFADEPTGNLDVNSANAVADILFSCCQQEGAGLVLVTHSDDLAARAEHVFTIKNGVCTVTQKAQVEVAQ